MGNITKDGEVEYSNLVYSDNESEMIEYQLKKGDILFNRTNSSEWVGKSALYDGKLEAIYAGYLVRVRPIMILSEYLILVMTSSYYRNWCHLVKTDAVNQSNINAQKLKSFLLPLPPLKEQRRIYDNFLKLSVLRRNISDSCNKLSDMISLTKSKILDLAMQGKLVPQDPSDESAAEMLHRINPKAKIITDNPHYPQLPDNWAYLSLSDINTYKSSTVTPANMPEQLFDLYSVPIFSTLMPEKTHGSEIGSAKQVIKKGDVLLCKINPHLNRVWEIIEDSHNVQIASSEWIVVRSELHHPSFLKWYFNSPKFRALLSSQVSGVGGSLTRAQPAIVKGYLVPVPPMEEQARISKAIEHWFECLDSIICGLSN